MGLAEWIIDDTCLVDICSNMPADFRDLISQKLAAKQDQLGQTEESIKKFVPTSQSPFQEGGNVMKRFQNRLGPMRPRLAMNSRLGPKVRDEEDLMSQERLAGGIQSRVVMEVKSRDEVLAEKKAVENKSEAQVLHFLVHYLKIGSYNMTDWNVPVCYLIFKLDHHQNLLQTSNYCSSIAKN